MPTNSEIRLPVWTGFRTGASAKPSTGRLEITLHGPRTTKAQRAALVYAKKHAARLKSVVLDAIAAGYPTLRPWKPRPKTMTPARLRTYVEPYGLTVVRDEHDGTAYLGYDFQCRWDPSGIVVLMHLLDHASATQRVLLGAIARAHPDVPRRHLEDHVQLLSAHVQAAPADKVAYVGYQLACDWEEEHGLGVLLHGDRVVEVGQADTAFLGWNADRDRVKRRTSRPQRVRS